MLVLFLAAATVKRALVVMEVNDRRTGTLTSLIFGSAPSLMQHEVLQNSFKDPPNARDCPASSSISAMSPCATAGKPPPKGRGRRVVVLVAVVPVRLENRRQIQVEVGRRMGRMDVQICAC